AAGPVLDMINRDFGDWANFRTKFIEAGVGRFGSGWVWLVLDDGHCKITATANADTPLTSSAKPLLVADVWEHAYYLDYQHKRDGFLTAFCDKLINWEFVQKNLRG
ncbi:MAG: Fe-Mn family superoxide dismutase, partial [Pseudomonadota bacterium]